MFIRDNCAWNIDKACALLSVSRSSYYEWISNIEKNKHKANEYELLKQRVLTIFKQSKNTYGVNRIMKELNKNAINCSYRIVLNIMNELNLKAIGAKKYKILTTNSNHRYKVFNNLLEQNFNVDKPNQVWVSDISYIRTNEGWLYLATVIDLFSRKLIGYKMDSRMTRDLVISALQNALKARQYPKNVIVHTDRGSQYASNDYKGILNIHNLIGSMSRKGNCWDNAVAESFFATLKKEYVYNTIFKTRLDAQLGIFDYIETWYNKERIHSKLGDLSPNQFERKYRDKSINKNLTNMVIKNGTIYDFLAKTSVSGIW